jgi:DNA-binding MarR family transcriptional regulator
MQNHPKPSKSRPAISTSDYQTLSQFRYLIRCFLEFSQNKARGAGLAPRQHQALLAIKGFPKGPDVTIGDLAERLRIRHHSAVELVDRLVESGLVSREQDSGDHRRVLLRLTDRAEDHLADLSAAHLDELSRIEPMLTKLLNRGG